MNLEDKSYFLLNKYSELSSREFDNFSISKKSIIFILHKILDGFNISLLLLIFVLSFLSFNSQSKWTEYYSIIKDMRSINKQLVDYISLTEESYINEIYKLDNFKKTTSKDLIYISANIKTIKKNKFYLHFLNLSKGIREGRYQIGNL
tara:strand:+ start:392 stop:835 length:444 start_codon:yes stop_codon:yes gene_type:complete